MLVVGEEMVQRGAEVLAAEYGSEQPAYDAKHYRELVEKVLIAALGVRDEQS